MCRTCGCTSDEHERPNEHEHDEDGGRHVRTVRLQHDLLADNDHLAFATRIALADRRVGMLNLIGAPGAGKTALLEATIPRLLEDDVAVAVLEGDQATDRDAARIRAAGCPVVQLNTGPGCHLDAAMVREGLRALAPPPSSVVFVENVGNLVCPALFDVGERAKVVVMSVTEGDDKPLKYPHVFRAAEVFVLTKVDLLRHVPFDVDRCCAYAREVNPRIRVLPVSAVAMDGIDAWCDWVRGHAA